MESRGLTGPDTEGKRAISEDARLEYGLYRLLDGIEADRRAVG
jgi:hypothetical protein